ncbi:thiamine phosphate synthase [Vibrio tritonius]|uniref:Thiamine phosphate synthase n=1 Tax=Vibrio tritonius TaxID=1435069 RepID=A0ABS7YKM7_9VIBR|nr:thiamine phosphate synthase [Vibrio tritonius]MCA2015019.1 thiamine phosphate synthase [Vibrio tritonius]
MIKIHIPKHWPYPISSVAEFITKVEHHLCCAKRNNVCSNEFVMKFEMVDEPTISLRFDDSSALYIDVSIGTNSSNHSFLSQESQESEPFISLHYVHDFLLQKSNLHSRSANPPAYNKKELLLTSAPNGTDYLISSRKGIQFERLPIDIATHFSWFVVLLALEFTIEDSLLLARSLGHVSRETSWPVKRQDFACPVDWVFDESNVPHCKEQLDSPKPFPSTLSEISLYPVVDNNLWLEQLLQLGVKTIQLRIKNAEKRSLEKAIEEAVQLGKTYQAAVYINDHWQLALKCQAYGVHLGQDDISQENISLLQQANIRLGISTHGYFEILRVYRSYPSYIALGHVFSTTTKNMPSRPQGLYKLALYQKFIEGLYQSLGSKLIPTVAIGGIQLDNAREVYRTGVNSVAVVRAVSSTLPNLSSVVREFEMLKLREVTDVNSN